MFHNSQVIGIGLATDSGRSWDRRVVTTCSAVEGTSLHHPNAAVGSPENADRIPLLESLVSGLDHDDTSPLSNRMDTSMPDCVVFIVCNGGKFSREHVGQAGKGDNSKNEAMGGICFHRVSVWAESCCERLPRAATPGKAGSGGCREDFKGGQTCASKGGLAQRARICSRRRGVNRVWVRERGG